MFLFTLVLVSLGAVSTLDKGSYGYKGKRVYEYGYGKGQYGRRVDNYQPIGQYERRGQKYQPKYECKVNTDCTKGYICSDNYCVPDCGPCSEFDFSREYCKCSACQRTTTQEMTNTTAAPPRSVDVRLPRTIVPDLYTLELFPNMYNANPEIFTFEGTVKIRMLCKLNTQNITLHSNNLNITTDNVLIIEEGGNRIGYSEMTTDTLRQFIIFHLTRELTADKYYTIELPFIGPLKNDLSGLFYSSYRQGNETRYVAATQLEPTDARKIFPCFDEPALKAKFDITIVRKKDMVALTTTEKISSENRGGDWIADKFARTVTMPTYLLSFFISDFKSTETITKRNVTIRTWARPEAVSQTSYGTQICAIVTEKLEDYFNSPYQLKKQDNFPIPDHSGWAMENWGVITYREQTLLYDPVESSEADKQRVTRVVTHELGHMWFGNLVSPAWWDHLWLKEGFATVIEWKAVDFIYPDWKMMEQFISEIHFVFMFDSLMSSRPVLISVSFPKEIVELFDPICYLKAGAIIRMMNFFLGEEIWQKGLIRYLNQHKYEVATQDDLWYALGNQSKADNGPVYDVKNIMDTWTKQINYPVVMVDRVNNNRIRITQNRFLRFKGNENEEEHHSSEYGYRWDIPFTFTTSSSPHFNQTYSDIRWLRRNTATYEIHLDTDTAKSSWIIGNVMMYGYFRVNYDENNWNQIIQQLNTDHTVIHSINRAQIINDAFNLAKSADLGIDIAMKTLDYLDREMEYLPWKTAITELTYLSNMLERTELYGKLGMYAHKKMSGIFNSTGLDNSGATHLQSLFRTIISETSCSAGVRMCVDKSKDLFKQWMNNPRFNPIDSSVRSAVYCTAVSHGGVDEWMFVLSQYQISNVAHEKLKLLYSLACTKQVWLLSRLMKLTLDTDYVRLHDAGPVIVALANNEISTALVFDFVRENWETISTVYAMHLPLIIPEITKKFNKDYQLKQLEDFVEEYRGKSTDARVFKQAVEQTKINIEWMKRNYNALETWLQDY